MDGHLIIHMDNSVEEYKSSISYRGVNLISDIGGTLGLFLGWSIALCANYVVNLVKSKTMRSFVTSTMVLILFIGFVQWSSPVFEKFIYEEETVELQTEQGYTPPYVTMCPYESFHAWLQANFVWYSHNNVDDDNFYDFVSYSIQFNWIPILEKLSSSEFSLNTNTIFSLLSDKDSLVIDNSILKKVFHPKFGICFSLDAKQWSRYLYNLIF